MIRVSRELEPAFACTTGLDTRSSQGQGVMLKNRLEAGRLMVDAMSVVGELRCGGGTGRDAARYQLHVSSSDRLIATLG